MSLCKKLNIEHLDLEGKRVLMRVDFNVSMQEGKITSNQRILAALPTIQYAINKGAKSVILMSHLGRPDGKVVPTYSLAPVAKELELLLDHPVKFLNDCIGPEIEAECANSPPGSVILLENLRFHMEEEGSVTDASGSKHKANEDAIKKFRDSLSTLGDVFVNDAFGTAHRAHSSMVGIQLPFRASGFLMKKELDAFSQVLENTKRPLLAILGGAKVSDKIKLIENMLERVDRLIIGGGMAYTFKKMINNVGIGNSLFDMEGAKLVHLLVQKAKEKNIHLLFPVDYVIANKFDKDADMEIVTDEQGIPEGWAGLDCGPESIKQFREIILTSKTVIWNGPLGVFEFDKFSKGTRETMNILTEATKQGIVTIIGGGDTATAAEQFGFANNFTHMSTGGGAGLELLEGKELPGITALTDV